MPREISNDFRNEIYDTSMEAVPLVVLDVTHPSIHPEVIRLVNNNQDITWNGNLYLASNFNFTPPTQEGSTASDASLTIQNIDRRLVTLIRSIQGKPSVDVNIVIVSGGSVQREAGPFGFLLNSVSYNADTVTAHLTYDLIPNQILSTITFKTSSFPGLIS